MLIIMLIIIVIGKNTLNHVITSLCCCCKHSQPWTIGFCFGVDLFKSSTQHLSKIQLSRAGWLHGRSSMTQQPFVSNMGVGYRLRICIQHPYWIQTATLILSSATAHGWLWLEIDCFIFYLKLDNSIVSFYYVISLYFTFNNNVAVSSN